MISVCIPLSNDSYFLKRKKIIFNALRDLFNNLSFRKIKSQIVIVDYGGKKDSIDFRQLDKKKSSHVSIKYLKVNNKLDNSFYYGDALKIAINNADGNDILIKASDTFLNKEIYDLLKSKYNLEENFYCAIRKDFKFTVFKNKKEFLKRKCNTNENTDFLMKKINLHTNAVGDFILVKKNKIDKIKYFQRFGFHNDTFIVGCLHFMGLKQKMINKGFVFKILHNRNFHQRHKVEETNIFFKYLENKVFYKTKYRLYLVEILRAIFDYPKISNQNYDSISRIKLKIFLRFFKINLYPNIKTNINESEIILIKDF